jgi:hypothetical protein
VEAVPKTIRFHKIGGPENLILEDVSSRQLEEGEVRLRVEAVGLNRAESLFFRGLYGEQPVLPSRVGYEAAGTVVAVEPGVDPSWVGKKVATTGGVSQSRNGVLGEEAIVPVASLAEYPANLSSIEGAAIWMQYLTAYGALIMHGKIAPGDFVIIPAASSSVGIAAIQLTKGAGATAIATTRTSKEARRATGARRRSRRRYRGRGPAKESRRDYGWQRRAHHIRPGSRTLYRNSGGCGGVWRNHLRIPRTFDAAHTIPLLSGTRERLECPGIFNERSSARPQGAEYCNPVHLRPPPGWPSGTKGREDVPSRAVLRRLQVP